MKIPFISLVQRVALVVTLILSILLPVNLQAVTVQQLNCTSNRDICLDVCSESKGALPYSSTFCDPESGNCICDCRDALPKECDEQPFTPCFQQCVRKNPNPDVFLYEGGNCPVIDAKGTIKYQCACGCSVRDDYEETNDVI